MLVTPFGNVVVEMLKGLVTVMLNACVAVNAVGFVESVAFTVKLDVPVALGVPVMAPVEVFSVAQPGSAPALMLQV